VARPASPRPTDAELAILRLMWARGPSTVREVFDELNRERPAGSTPGPVGYTTVLKAMQIMTDKGLLARDARRRTHVYRPAESGDQTRRKLVGDLLDRAFGGSARALIQQALSARKTSPAELAEIRKLIDEFKAGGPR
jgi:predicted transcriptional regulator